MLLATVLLQTFVLVGNVRDTGGRPVANVRVSLMDENNQTLRTVFADPSGHYEFKGLISARYFVRVEPVGTDYEPRTEQIELQSLALVGAPTETMHLDVILRARRDEAASGRAPSPFVFAQEVPEAARAEYRTGLREVGRNKHEAGIAALKRSVALFPDYFEALELLGSEYVKVRQFSTAVPVLMHAVEINEVSPRALYALGVAHLNLGSPQAAVRWLLKAQDLDGSNANVHMMLGLAYGKSNALDKAEESLRKAYELGGDLAADAHLYLAGIYNSQGKYSAAIRELQTFLKEAKDLKDKSQILKMIEHLKEKERSSAPRVP